MVGAALITNTFIVAVFLGGLQHPQPIGLYASVHVRNITFYNELHSIYRYIVVKVRQRVVIFLCKLPL